MVGTRAGFDPTESHHQRDRDVGEALIGSELDVREDLAAPMRHVFGAQAVEREHEHVVPTDIAATEVRHGRLEVIVLPRDNDLEDVRYPTMASSLPTGMDGTPVNVAPVVPVRRT